MREKLCKPTLTMHILTCTFLSQCTGFGYFSLTLTEKHCISSHFIQQSTVTVNLKQVLLLCTSFLIVVNQGEITALRCLLGCSLLYHIQSVLVVQRLTFPKSTRILTMVILPCFDVIFRFQVIHSMEKTGQMVSQEMILVCHEEVSYFFIVICILFFILLTVRLTTNALSLGIIFVCNSFDN